MELSTSSTLLLLRPLTPFLLGLGCRVGLEVFRAGTGDPSGDLCCWLLLLPLPPLALCTPSTHLLRSSSSFTWKRCSTPLAHTTLNMCFFLVKSLTASTEEVVRSSGGLHIPSSMKEGGREGENHHHHIKPLSRLVPPPAPPLIKTNHVHCQTISGSHSHTISSGYDPHTLPLHLLRLHPSYPCTSPV